MNHAHSPSSTPVARLTSVLITRYPWTSSMILRKRSSSGSPSPAIARSLRGTTRASPRAKTRISTTRKVLASSDSAQVVAPATRVVRNASLTRFSVNSVSCPSSRMGAHSSSCANHSSSCGRVGVDEGEEAEPEFGELLASHHDQKREAARDGQHGDQNRDRQRNALAREPQHHGEADGGQETRSGDGKQDGLGEPQPLDQDERDRECEEYPQTRIAIELVVDHYRILWTSRHRGKTPPIRAKRPKRLRAPPDSAARSGPGRAPVSSPSAAWTPFVPGEREASIRTRWNRGCG